MYIVHVMKLAHRIRADGHKKLGMESGNDYQKCFGIPMHEFFYNINR